MGTGGSADPGVPDRPCARELRFLEDPDQQNDGDGQRALAASDIHGLISFLRPLCCRACGGRHPVPGSDTGRPLRGTRDDREEDSRRAHRSASGGCARWPLAVDLCGCRLGVHPGLTHFPGARRLPVHRVRLQSRRARAFRSRCPRPSARRPAGAIRPCVPGQTG